MENIYFVKNPKEYFVIDAFVGYIFSVQDKMDLFLKLSKAFMFPDYFGKNWDALCEIYRDFDWIYDKKIVIIHESLSLLEDRDLNIYLDIVKITISFWSGFEDHSVIFVFPEKEKKRIINKIDL